MTWSTQNSLRRPQSESERKLQVHANKTMFTTPSFFDSPYDFNNEDIVQNLNYTAATNVIEPRNM